MTRRLQPPPHPVTSYPPVDNRLRNSWKEYRNFLTTLTPFYAHFAVFQGAPGHETGHPSDWAGNYYFTPPDQYGHRLPRKLKKQLRQETLKAAFIYHPTARYTPKEVLL